MKHLLSAVTVALALASSGVQAAVRYDFTALSATATNGERVIGSYSFTLPSFVSSSFVLPVAALSSCQATSDHGAASCIDPDVLPTLIDGYDTLTFGYSTALSSTVHNYYYFADGALSHYGSYASVLLDDQQGTLVVSEVSAVPEPTTALSLLAGMAVLVTLRRRAR